MKKIIYLFVLLFAGSVNAAITEFVPPNETVGSVYSTNSNDGYELGRGLVFQMTSNETINSVGIYHDLTDITLHYEIAQVLSATGDVTTGQTVLRNGSDVISNSGLQWNDFSFSDLSLTTGNYYHIEFSFDGNANQNFFYHNDNVVFSQSSFSLLDGTYAGDTSNNVMAAFRVNTVNAIPEPEIYAMLGIGLGLMGWVGRRKKLQAG